MEEDEDFKEGANCPNCELGPGHANLLKLKLNIPKTGVFRPYIAFFDHKMGTGSSGK
jgi:hypothetical protein